MRFHIASLIMTGVFLANTAAAAKLVPTVQAQSSTGGEVLDKRQSCPSGFGFCSNTGVCCPLGGECCSNGECCNPGAGSATWA
ncbi:hypothetical protein P691DRAFT_763518 [Macrolepiota fuliginosa MF-IS2]|uniref:Granulins domain-containing protein n=1 Tax=Macrolepiota fuliginosa MF-IS2 TaxID=1400762 RepID=A0A9P5X620_9AGAR|nr:hypothetical protein P691DRAFT_763518 [Macrolepiota fuliginosa MF-IS2]